MDSEETSFSAFMKRARQTTKNTISFVENIGNLGRAKAQGTGTIYQNEKQRRRAQVKKAQREHRQQKKNYVRYLEEEIIRLRRVYQDEESAMQILREENFTMKSTLSQVTSTIGGRNRTPDPLPLVSGWSDRRLVNFGYDEHVQANCLKVSHSSVAKTSEIDVAVDFVLSLEHNCSLHIPCYPYTPEFAAPATNHALLLSSYYVELAPESAFPPGTAVAPTDSSWEGPTLTLQKLHGLSQCLNVQSFEVTPVQAWFKLTQDHRWGMGEVMKKGVVEMLKQKLGGLVACRGFGAVLEIEEFERVTEEVLGGT